MVQCSAFGCKNTSGKTMKGITFHSFPKDVVRRKLWILAVKRKNWSPTLCSKLCSEHFSEYMIDRTSLSCVRLRENAVPDIFKAYPPYFQKESKPSERPKDRKKAKAKRPKIKRHIAKPKLKASIKKEQTEHTDENDNVSNNVMSNGNLLSDESYFEEGSDFQLDKNYPDTVKAESNTNNRTICNNSQTSDSLSNKISNFIDTTLPLSNESVTSYTVNSEPSPTFSPVILSTSSLAPLNIKLVPSLVPFSNKLSTMNGEKILNTCDASTCTVNNMYSENKLRKEVEQCHVMLDSYRKKIKTLHQQNRRYRARLLNMKSSKFRELHKRQCMSNDTDFKIDKKSCVLDRHCLKVCKLSDTQESGED